MEFPPSALLKPGSEAIALVDLFKEFQDFGA